MWRSLLVISFLFCSALFTYGSITEPHYYELFETGNTLYKSGQYDSAKTAYSEIIQNGYKSTELCYNYGNAFFKTGNIPAAILYYERALVLNPSNQDARHNLEIANSFVADKIDPLETLFISAWWSTLALSFHPDTWAWIIICLIALASLGIGFYLIGRESTLKQIGFFTAAISIAFALTAYSLAQLASEKQKESYAIVFTPSVNVKSEPDIKSTVQFVIHEGLKVKILDAEDDWVRVVLADGNTGWITSQSIERI